MSSGERRIGGKSQGRGSDMFLSTSLTRAAAGRWAVFVLGETIWAVCWENQHVSETADMFTLSSIPGMHQCWAQDPNITTWVLGLKLWHPRFE